jgi:radical SAM protein with 4Fe4S-binding SPASM domain
MKVELDTFRTNTGTLDARIQRVTGLNGSGNLIEQMKGRGQNRATDLLIESPCNESCSTCFFQEAGGPGKIRLTPEVVDNIRTTAEILGNPDPKLFTLYPKEITTAMPLLPVFSERSMTRTLTNGKRLGEPGVLQTLKNAGIMDLMITVPGRAAAYALYTREKEQTYDRLLNNIGLAVREGFNVGVFYPVFQPNVDDVLPTTLQLQELGVREIKFIRVIPVGAAQNLSDDMFLGNEETLQFLTNVNTARKQTQDAMELTLFGGSFGPNFYGKSIYRYLAGINDRWPGSQYYCPMINGQFIGITYGTGKAYPCFKALSFPELSSGAQFLTEENLENTLRGQCAKDDCQYQPLCLGGCRITAFAFAKRRGEAEPLYAGQDVCVTRLLEENQ